MERILRTMVTLIIVVGSFAWIVFSYIPDRLIEIPKYHFATDNVSPVSLVLFGISLVVILGLQLWITVNTGRSVLEYNKSDERQEHGFRLRTGLETTLTALPIGFTLLLGAAAIVWWQGFIRFP